MVRAILRLFVGDFKIHCAIVAARFLVVVFAVGAQGPRLGGYFGGVGRGNFGQEFPGSCSLSRIARFDLRI